MKTKIKKSYTYTTIGLMFMVLGISFFEDQPYLKFGCLGAALVLCFIGVMKTSKEKEIKANNQEETSKP